MGFFSFILLYFQILGCVFFGLHSYAPATCTEASRCTICYESKGSALGHQYTQNSCTEPSVCTVCNQVIHKATGHDFINGECRNCGNPTGDEFYELGKTFVMDGAYEFRVNSVKKHYLCNQYADYVDNPIYIINFTYKNLGFTEGLEIDYFSGMKQVYDEKMEIGDIYPCTHTKDAKKISIGTSCTAEEAIVFNNECSEITICIVKKLNGIEHRATFKYSLENNNSSGNNNNNNNNNNTDNIDPNYTPSASSLAGIKKYKDVCKSRGSYSNGEYVINSNISSSNKLKMIYNSTTDKLRFEQTIKSGSTSTKLILWIDEYAPTHRWEFDYEYSGIHLKGSGKYQKGSGAATTLSQLESSLNMSEFYEVDGQSFNSRERDIFMNNVSSGIRSIPYAIQTYFMNNGMSTYDTSCFEIG